MATRVSARINDDGSDDDDGIDHPQARKYTDLVKKNAQKSFKEAEDNVWKGRIKKEERKNKKYCLKINKRTGKRIHDEEVYNDPKGRNTKGYCQRHFYIDNSEMRKAKKNASHPMDPPPAPSKSTFFPSTTETTTSPVDDEQLLLRVRKANPNFQLHDTTQSTSQANNNNSSNTTTAEDEERKRKFQEEEAKREKEEEERLVIVYREAAEKRARMLKRAKEQALKQVEEKLRKEADGDTRMQDVREKEQGKEIPLDDPKAKDGTSPSGVAVNAGTEVPLDDPKALDGSSFSLNEEDERFLQEQTRQYLSDMDLKI